MENQQVINNQNNKNVILPYSTEKEYYIEDLGEINEKKSYVFMKRLFDIILSVF